MRTTFALVALLGLSALLSAADAPRPRPDFSGTWALVNEAGGAIVPLGAGDRDTAARNEARAESSGGVGAGAGAAMPGDIPLEAMVDARRLVIVDDGTTLRITYPSGRKRTLHADDEERLLDDGDGPARVTAKRKGDAGEKVVVTSAWPAGGRGLAETWELRTSPRRLVVTGRASGREKTRYERVYAPAPPAPPVTPTPVPSATPGASPSPAAPKPGTPAATPSTAPAAPPAGYGACSVRPPKGAGPAELRALARVSETEASRRASASLAPLTAASVISSDLEVREGCLVWPILLRIPEKNGGQEVLIDAGDGKVIASSFEPL